MAADKTPATSSISVLDDALGQLVGLADVPGQAKSHLQHSKRSLGRMGGSLESAREAFRPLSHAMLKAATLARGDKTAIHLVHMFCPMVPGGGGDWMQPGGDLVNPYWGAEMLGCGEVVRDLSLSIEVNEE